MRAVQVAADRAGPGPRGSGWTRIQVRSAAEAASLVVTKGSAYPPKGGFCYKYIAWRQPPGSSRYATGLHCTAHEHQCKVD